MYKLLLVFCFWLPGVAGRGQNDIQKWISTEDGLFTVSKTSGNMDMILFPASLWDDMMVNTRFISGNLNFLQPVKVHIAIADKKQFHCKGGIGFRCSIYYCNCEPSKEPKIVNTANRICCAILTKIYRDAIQIVFCNQVDWEGLTNNDD